MCPDPPQKAPCGNYTPDYDRSTSMCYGFGYSPPCVHCDRNEDAHWWVDRILEGLDVPRSVLGL